MWTCLITSPRICWEDFHCPWQSRIYKHLPGLLFLCTSNLRYQEKSLQDLSLHLPGVPALTRGSTTDALLGLWLPESGFRWGCAIPKILRLPLSNFIFCMRMLNPFLQECFVSLRLFWGLLAAVEGITQTLGLFYWSWPSLSAGNL